MSASLGASLGKRAYLAGSDDASAKRRARSTAFTVSQREFSSRIRFRDTNGYTYAVPLLSDPLLYQYVRNGTIRLGIPYDKDSRLEAPLNSGGKVMLYMRKPRTKDLVPLPRGRIQLLNLETQTVVEATVSIVVSTQMNKPGHIILENLIDTGRVGMSSEFRVKKRSHTL